VLELGKSGGAARRLVAGPEELRNFNMRPPDHVGPASVNVVLEGLPNCSSSIGTPRRTHDPPND
jgi:hypothetical protein